jgi:type I restriction enzyme, R subunit
MSQQLADDRQAKTTACAEACIGVAEVMKDYGKLFFNIIDYTGTATANFADSAFDGEPTTETITEIGPDGEIRTTEIEEHPPTEPPDDESTGDDIGGPVGLPPETGDEATRKFYVDGGEVEIIHHLVYELDTDGRRLTCKALTDWTGEKVRALYPSSARLRADWTVADKRKAIVETLAERGIDLEMLAADVGRPDDDPSDLLCHLAWNAPLRTRRERAQDAPRASRFL